MRDQYYRVGQGFILVYSIDSRRSFEEIQVIHEQMLRVKVSGGLGSVDNIGRVILSGSIIGKQVRLGGSS